MESRREPRVGFGGAYNLFYKSCFLWQINDHDDDDEVPEADLCMFHGTGVPTYKEPT